MKKVILIVSLLLVLTMSVGAQDKVTGITAKGFKAGLNIAGHTGDDADDYLKNMLTFAFGGFMTYNINEQFAIQPELLYMMKGTDWEHISGTWKAKYNYLEIPILFKYLIPTQSNFKPNIFAGPSVGILMSAEEEMTDDSGTEILDVKDVLRSTDVGIAFGLGGSFVMGKGSLTFDARYTVGMTDIYKEDPDFGQWKIKSKVISFMLGYGF